MSAFLMHPPCEESVCQERIHNIGRLSAFIVHDLRSPLATIHAGTEMLMDSTLPESQVKRLVGNINRASCQLEELLQELLNATLGKSTEMEHCSLRKVVAAACETMAETAETQSVQLVLEVPDDIELFMERNRIERVFVNLVSNAVEAMPGGGTVRISAAIAEDAALVEVRDTGPGIAPKIRGRLFQPFVRAGKQNGLGLGLALACQTIRDHGGNMWMASDSDRGACFRFGLPLPRSQEARKLQAFFD
jgi:signal transduction histidine kinase